MVDFKVTTQYNATTGDWQSTLATGKSLTGKESAIEAEVFFDNEGYYVWYVGFEAMLNRFKV